MNTSTIRNFLEIREISNQLCDTLETEDYVTQTIYDVSPIKWHLGHTSWFFETFILKKFIPTYQVYHDRFGYIFNSYYNTLGERVSKDNRGIISRPTVKDVFAYREHVNSNIVHFLESNELTDEIALLIRIGLNHEQQHQELMVYDIKHIFFTNVIQPVYSQNKINSSEYIEPHYVSFDKGLYEIGAKSDSIFAFDNEYPEHQHYLDPFSIRNTLVTNKEYLDFILDSGYQTHEFWLDDGWHLYQNSKINHPLYWKKVDDEWVEWTLAGERKLDLNAPVSHISYYEADAFSAWAGKRLPTEQEWEVVAQNNMVHSVECNFLDNKLFHAVQSHTSNAIHHLHGNLWEWTSSAYLSYPGYKKPKGAIGEYNAKFMSGQMVLRGGSYATSSNHYRSTYRNFFQPDKRWLLSGIRLAETI